MMSASASDRRRQRPRLEIKWRRNPCGKTPVVMAWELVETVASSEQARCSHSEALHEHESSAFTDNADDSPRDT